ncbi:MAG TPA: M20/M25/M40 family metallo-hydrolase [Gemmatimonadales bacterium]|nr:M20/M25/M40 family metallo-hydrolase [Gemmatimonadales bacterium]
MTRFTRVVPLFLFVLVPAVLTAQSLTGYSASAGQRQASLEQLLVTLGDTGRAREHSRSLSAEPHVAGTPAQQRTAQYVLTQMKSFGLDTSRADFEIWLPHPESTVVELVSPTRERLALDEPALPEDATSQRSVWRAMNGYAADGDVTAGLVYVNYGLPDDYRTLDSLGISVKGKVAIARYGRSFRGIKAREAEAHGARALLLYSDPQDDGYVPGDIYPEGPMRHPLAPQRGSVYNGNGDPGSPTWSSLPGATRLTEAEMNIPRIPVVPLGYGNAAKLLQPLRGPGVPRAWQGGLPFHYHFGGNDVTVRVGVWNDAPEKRWKRVTNTFGIIKGTDYPDELVIVGGHRDAWGPGAQDNVSGTTSILEAARMVAQAAKKGFKPRRTIVFATWDAEEWGLLGSTEWVEWREKDLTANAVAYLNLDVSAGGTNFGSGGTGSLHPLMRELTRLVRQPYDSTSVYLAWRRGDGLADSQEVSLGDLGGGSDFAGFYNHLAIPSADFGFNGPGGIYHSAYDSYDWMRRFGDPGYQGHVAAATIAALWLTRTANADLSLLDYREYANHLIATVKNVAESMKKAGRPLDLSPLSAAIERLGTAGDHWSSARAAALGGKLTRAQVTAANATVRQVEKALARPEGLTNRPWMRNLIFASDRDNGYSNVAFPSVVEPWQDKNDAKAAAELADLVQRFDAAAALLDKATATVRAK